MASAEKGIGVTQHATHLTDGMSVFGVIPKNSSQTASLRANTVNRFTFFLIGSSVALPRKKVAFCCVSTAHLQGNFGVDKNASGKANQCNCIHRASAMVRFSLEKKDVLSR